LSYIEVDASKAISALQGFGGEFAGEIINNIAARLGKNIFKKAFANLSGSHDAGPNTWPVPVRTGNLRRSLYLILPSGAGYSMQDKEGGGSSMKKSGKYEAGPGEAWVGASAEYAGVIEDGRVYKTQKGFTGSYQRPFLTDPAREFLGLAPQFAEQELAKGIKKYGLE